MRIAVVGAGFSGLVWAERILRQGHEVVVFDKAHALGGVWRTAANRGSRVQMVEPDYGMWERPWPAGVPAPSGFTPRDEMLAQARAFAEATGVAPRIRFGTAVVRVDRDADGCTLTLASKGRSDQRRFDGVAVLPGTLTRPRRLDLPGLADFAGPTGIGVGDDLDPRVLSGKRVVIVGMGSFAIENAREALEHGAAHVTLVARGFNVVAPQVASLRVCHHLVWRGEPVLETLRAPYAAIGRLDLLARLQDGHTRAQRTIPPMSDLFFIAQHFGRLDVIQGEAARAETDGLTLRDGRFLPADALLTCVGFEREHTSERLAAMLGEHELNGMFIDRDRRFAFSFEPVHGGMDAHQGIPFASHLTITRTLADLYVYFLERPDAFAAIASRLPRAPEAAGFSGADYAALFSLVMASSTDTRAIVLHHLAMKVARCEARHDERAFLAHNRLEWARHCAALGGSEASLPYPFRPRPAVRRRLQAWAVGRWARWRRRRVFGDAARAPEPVAPPPTSAGRPASPAVRSGVAAAR